MRLMLVIISMMMAARGMRAEVAFRVSGMSGTVEVSEVEEAGTFDVTISAEWPEGGETYVVYTPAMPEIQGMTITDHVPFGETISGVSQTIQRIVHQFRLFVTNAAGTRVETGPIVVEYRRGDREEREKRELAGIGLAVVEKGRRGITGVMIGATGAVVVGLGVLGASTYRKRRRRRGAVAEEASIESKYMEALEASTRIRIEGDLGRYFLTLEQLLREYLREKYCIGNVEAWERGGNGRGGLDERSMGVAKELVGMAQRVRYAGYVPSAHEQRRMYEYIESLLERNQPRRCEPEGTMYLQKEKAI